MRMVGFRRLPIGQIEHRRLTLREIEAAGIDTRAPENHFVYEFNVEVSFRDSPVTNIRVTMNGAGEVLDGGCNVISTNIILKQKAK